MNDAEARLAERLAADLERVLGAGILIEDLEIDCDGPATVRIACLADGVSLEIEATGETAIEVIADATRASAEARLAVAFRHLVAPT